jgi:hypothetical protein
VWHLAMLANMIVPRAAVWALVDQIDIMKTGYGSAHASWFSVSTSCVSDSSKVTVKKVAEPNTNRRRPSNFQGCTWFVHVYLPCTAAPYSPRPQVTQVTHLDTILLWWLSCTLIFLAFLAPPYKQQHERPICP